MIGRFITPDSIIPGPGNPQAFNRYSYCLNNPLAYVDPNGQFPWLIASAVIGALIAGHQSDWDPGAMALGALTSVITAGAFDIAGGICFEIHANLIQASAIHFAAGGIAGGINAAITGGDIGEGMLYSAASAGVGCYIGGKLNLGLPGTMFVGGVTSGTISVMNGGEFGQAFGYSIAHGAMMAGAGYMFNGQGDHWLYNKLRSFYCRITAPNPYDSRTWTGGDVLAARKYINESSYIKYPPGDPLIGDQQIQMVEDLLMDVGQATLNQAIDNIPKYGPWINAPVNVLMHFITVKEADAPMSKQDY